ncbi:MAG: DNA translocase FtsK [Planctomycetaceae bacterium]
MGRTATGIAVCAEPAVPSRNVMLDYHRLRTDLAALFVLAACCFTALALGSYHPGDPPSPLVYPTNPHVLNLCGPLGARIAHGLQTSLGMAAWMVLAALLAFDLRLFSRQPPKDSGLRIIGWLILILATCLALQMFVPGLGNGPPVGSGGYLGAWGKLFLIDQLSTTGALIVISTMAVAGLLLSHEWLLFRVLGTATMFPVRVLGWTGRQTVGRLFQQRHQLPVPTTATSAAVESAAAVVPAAPAQPMSQESSEALEDSTTGLDDLAADSSSGETEFKVNPPAHIQSVGDATGAVFVEEWPETAYELPDLDLLEEAEEFPFELLAKKAQASAAILEKTFAQFGLNVKVSEIDTGPVVTQFELDLEPGLRVSKVVNLQDDLAIALRVPAVRVVSPIPGKNTVGVEVPNDKRVMVRLKELLTAGGTAAESLRIPIYLGKDVSGHPLVVDMTKMPHLLIAGRTGTGKSVCLNTLITSILMTRSPDDVRMLMIDPKMVELSPYTRIPHLMHPVITDMKKAEAVLAWAVDKMEERYDLLARVGVRHLDSYNKLGKQAVLKKLGLDGSSEEAEIIPDRMPYIVIIADEMADLMMTSGKDVEAHIIRLAQKSRAVGIHLVLATQKPTVDVITGLIKSNLPARIAFQVASRTDSRVVLDEGGADRLLGNGDMLYLAPGTSTLTRAQGTFISDDEVHSVLQFYEQYEPQYEDEVEQATKAALRNESGGGDGGDRPKDDVYPQAVEVVIREGRGSVSLLQRALGIGYGRAARMIDWMAEDGIVGDYNGSKCREVVCTLEDWQQRQSSREPLEV